MRSSWTIWLGLSSDKWPYKREEEKTHPQRGGPLRQEAETGGTQPHAGNAWTTRELQEARKGSPWSLWGNAALLSSWCSISGTVTEEISVSVSHRVVAVGHNRARKSGHALSVVSFPGLCPEAPVLASTWPCFPGRGPTSKWIPRPTAERSAPLRWLSLLGFTQLTGSRLGTAFFPGSGGRRRLCHPQLLR